jgi:hypothetical protein
VQRKRTLTLPCLILELLPFVHFYTLNFVRNITLTLQKVYFSVSKTYSVSINRFLSRVLGHYFHIVDLFCVESRNDISLEHLKFNRLLYNLAPHQCFQHFDYQWWGRFDRWCCSLNKWCFEFTVNFAYNELIGTFKICSLYPEFIVSI